MLRCASRPMVNLLREKYLNDKTCLIGDIDFLFAFDGVGKDEKHAFSNHVIIGIFLLANGLQMKKSYKIKSYNSLIYWVENSGIEPLTF